MPIFGILAGSMAALGLATVVADHAGPYGDQLGGGQVVDRSATADIAANLTASAWRHRANLAISRDPRYGPY